MASPGATLSQVMMATGQGLAGASGDISFMANGEVSYSSKKGLDSSLTIRDKIGSPVASSTPVCSQL